jgi:predicted dithiol-disulfide oxidoreductase (DUF899 family)
VHQVVPHEQWLEARKAFLAQEKAFTRERDRLSQARRDLPWERVDKDYVFDGPAGKQTLAQLFGSSSQLVVYHFMYDPEWNEGCTSCSFWADNFNGIPIHLRRCSRSRHIASGWAGASHGSRRPTATSTATSG